MLMGILGAACWGASGVLLNFLVDHYTVSNTWVGCVRMLIAGVVFMAIALATDRQRLFAMLKDRKAMTGVLLFGLFGMALFQVTWMFAISTAGAAAESLISQVFLAYIMVFNCRVNCRFPRKSEVIGVILALTGVFFIATKGNPGTLAIGAAGLAWCLVDSVLMFLHNTLPLYALREYGSLNVNAVGIMLAGVIMVPFAQPWNIALGLDAFAFGLVAASALIGAVLGYVLSMGALEKVGPLLGSLTLVFDPVSAVFLSVILLGTSFTAYDFIGIVAILAMIVVMTVAGESED